MEENLLLPQVPVTSHTAEMVTDDLEICWIYNELADIPDEFIVVKRPCV